MLTESEERYLAGVPENKIAVIEAFDPCVADVAQELMKEIRTVIPSAEIYFLGASSLSIAGQNDIDMTIVAKAGQFQIDRDILIESYGLPAKENETLIKWEFDRDGFEVELYLNDKLRPGLEAQIEVTNRLKNDAHLRQRYEEMKLAANGIPFREYMRLKYEFFHEILGR